MLGRRLHQPLAHLRDGLNEGGKEKDKKKEITKQEIGSKVSGKKNEDAKMITSKQGRRGSIEGEKGQRM